LTTLRTILLSLVLFYSGIICAQDFHFSQFFNTNMLINPANTGAFDGDWQASAGYRNQWKAIAQPYQTLNVAYERQFYAYNQHFSGGLYILHDNSGTVALKSNQFILSGAYHRTLNNNQLSGGLQLGYVYKVVDYADNTFPDQYDPDLGMFNPLLTTDAHNGDHLSYFDINAGISWKKKIGKLIPELGISVFHLNSPKESFLNENIHVPVKEALHVGLRYDITPGFFLKPQFLLMNQSQAKDFILGSHAGYELTPNPSGVKEINIGLYFRNSVIYNTDAMIFTLGTTVRNLNIGISYDFNVSSLKAYSNNRGAFEISLIYRSISTILNTFSIPCERF
jgi:type IX secretion system PorP/SprF family membrane protein